jgi:1-acyl-sn-glycerol-3-phosphate acyltransferase
MKPVIGLVRIPAFLTLTVAYIIGCFLGGLLFIPTNRRKEFLTRMTSIGCRIALGIFGIRVTVRNPEKCRLHEGRMLAVANHVSYLDILILSSLYRSLFITSVEVQKTFFLGTLAAFGGSLFVERRSKSKLLEEIDRIAGVLSSGPVVTLFPEGTSSNGEAVLPFKGSLFTAAEKAGVDIQPISIAYRKIEGKQVSPENRDLAFFYGDIEFFPHLLRLFFVGSMEVTVTFLDSITSAGKERKEIVDEAYGSIAGEYGKERTPGASGQGNP